jgi:hypothetical protein
MGKPRKENLSTVMEFRTQKAQKIKLMQKTEESKLKTKIMPTGKNYADGLNRSEKFPTLIRGIRVKKICPLRWSFELRKLGRSN